MRIPGFNCVKTADAFNHRVDNDTGEEVFFLMEDASGKANVGWTNEKSTRQNMRRLVAATHIPDEGGNVRRWWSNCEAAFYAAKHFIAVMEH